MVSSPADRRRMLAAGVAVEGRIPSLADCIGDGGATVVVVLQGADGEAVHPSHERGIRLFSSARVGSGCRGRRGGSSL